MRQEKFHISKEHAAGMRTAAIKKKWELTPYDIRRGKNIHKNEQVSPVNKETMFHAGLYCILSASEIYTKQMRAYNDLFRYGLDKPEIIVNDKSGLEYVLRIARFPNQKSSRVYNFAVWWLESNLPDKLIEDIAHDRKDEIEIRNELAKDCPGLSYKGASLYLGKFGYQQVVPLDIWMLRFLHDLGYDIPVPDYKTVSGLQKGEYLKGEKIFRKLAKKQNLTPMVYQCALWGKHSAWEEKVSIRCLSEF